jgi:hypothetical protein
LWGVDGLIRTSIRILMIVYYMNLSVAYGFIDSQDGLHANLAFILFLNCLAFRRHVDDLEFLLVNFCFFTAVCGVPLRRDKI